MFYNKKVSEYGFHETEKKEWSFYIQNIQPGMTIFDVGANAGELSLLYSHFTTKSGRVHAFEPTPSTFKKLKMVSDAVRAQNVVPNNIALSKQVGEVTLYEYEEKYSGLNTIVDRPLKEQGFDIEPIRTISIPCSTLDIYCVENEIEVIDLLKIDVEGAELDVLKGAEELFRKQKVKCCVYEFGQPTYDMGNKREDFIDFFKKHNYKIKNIIKKESVMPTQGKRKGTPMSLNVATPG